MRRFRNPRYAPEALERKLHPTGLAIPVTAEFATTSATPATSATATDPPPTTPTPTPTPTPTEPWGEPLPPNQPDNPD